MSCWPKRFESLEAETRGRTVDWRLGRLSPVECDAWAGTAGIFQSAFQCDEIHRPAAKRPIVEVGEECTDGSGL